MPTDFAVFNGDTCVNAAADVELRGQAHEPGRDGGREMIEDFIGDCFVEGASVAKRGDAELQ
jgi:hypothetical protein